jgi:hypothetical protein
LDTTLCFHFRLWYRHLHLLSALDPYRYWFQSKSL